MTLIFIDHKFQYELERLFRNFFPPMELKLSRDRADAVGDYCLTERSEFSGGVSLSVELVCAGKRYSMSRTLPQETPDKEQEREMSVLLYKALREYTGHDLPWGILTGVRPVKVLSKLTDAQALQSLLVSPRKLAVARRIEQVQKPLENSIPMNSFSLYVSIPFCPTRCSYCSFVSHSVNQAAARLDEYLGRVTEEMKQLATISRHLGLLPDTIYFGGGTPTVLSAEQLKRLFAALEYFDLSRVREFTVEAGRPDTITPDKLAAIKEAGAGRVSVNPQTMNDSVLKTIGRAHTSAETEQAFLMARETGFGVINMDLIAGLPGEDFDSFAASLDAVCGLSPENITVHSLSLKRAAALFREGVDSAEGQAERMVDYAHRKLAESGYVPYYLYRQKNTADNQENTGYAKPGTESLYNTYIMEELQTILAVGAGATTKLVDRSTGRIQRITNHKYPYEYLDRFNDILENKRQIFSFFV
ncbi:MAG: coproporphyrinogen dehydrogenase HemZ [Oscillospiraceae bacterium]|nr:coproporphyrinogen dehydrogenase HemZ [Oscillospiraceae bacterium]